MYVQFACTNCGKNLKVREENVGRRVRCPYCQHALTIKPTGETPSGAGIDQAPHSVSTAEWSEGTDVRVKTGAALGLAIAVAFYLFVAIPFDVVYLGELFLDRGWVPFVLTFLMGWSIAILYIKSKKLEQQRDSMLFDLLPNQIADEITPKNVDLFANYLRGLPVQPSQSFLVNRVLRGLEHFRVLRSNSEVASRLASQSEIDATSVESSYTLLRVFIWAIPILGFIGTVIGISGAVSGFSGSLDQAQDLAILKTSLNDVTGGLATAFDTTLVALVMSLLVMFPASSMQKAEEDLLNWVDEYCNENLLKRLKDGDRATEGSGVLVGGSSQSSLELRAWVKKIEAVGNAITQQMVEGWSSIDKQLQAKHTAQVEQMKHAMSELARVQVQVAESMTGAAQSLDKSLSGLREGVASSGDQEGGHSI